MNTTIVAFLIFVSALVALGGIILALVLRYQKNKRPPISIAYVEIDENAETLMLGDTEIICLKDILNFRQTSQYHKPWNEYGWNNNKYDLAYRKNGEKTAVRLVVYDNEVESINKCNQLKFIVAKLRNDRIQKMKRN